MKNQDSAFIILRKRIIRKFKKVPRAINALSYYIYINYNWLRWRLNYKTDRIALAQAIWWLNKFVKLGMVNSNFYVIKEIWINNNQNNIDYVEFVRTETTPSGIEKNLYAYFFKIDGVVFGFHSYTPPKTKISGKGDNKNKYGRQIKSEEISNLPLTADKLYEVVCFKMFNKSRFKGSIEQFLKEIN